MSTKVFRERQDFQTIQLSRYQYIKESNWKDHYKFLVRKIKKYMLTQLRIVETKRIYSMEVIRNRVKVSSVNGWQCCILLQHTTSREDTKH